MSLTCKRWQHNVAFVCTAFDCVHVGTCRGTALFCILLITSSNVQEAEGRKLIHVCYQCPLIARLAAGVLQHAAASQSSAASLKARTTELVKSLKDCIAFDRSVQDYPTNVYKVYFASNVCTCRMQAICNERAACCSHRLG